MSPTGEPPLSRALAVFTSSKERRDLERKVLSAAFKASFESGDTEGAALAHKGLCAILQAQLFDGDGSSGSVIPASVWQQASPESMQPTTVSSAHEALTEAVPALTEADLNDWNEHEARTEAVPALTEADLEEWNYHEARTECVPALTEADLADVSALSEEPAAPAEITTEAFATAGLSENTLAQLFDDTDADEQDESADEESDEQESDEEQPDGQDEDESGDEEFDDEELDDEELDDEELDDEELDDEELDGAELDGEEFDDEELEGEQFEVEFVECVSTQDPAHLECTTSSPAFEPVAMPVVEKAMFEAPTPELEPLAPNMVPDLVGFEDFGEMPAAAEAPGPLGYLDFGDDENADGDQTEQPTAAAIADMLACAPPSNEPPRQLTPSELIKTQTFYQILGVNKLSSYEIIHTRYLRIMRRLLQTRYSVESPIKDMREFREILRAICVAHDVLKDPVTRTDYDLRQLGMRTNEGKMETTPDGRPTPLPPRARLMIGELLECANILDNTELQIALDMHRAEPGVQFGQFLVRAGFLNPEELDSALLGQKLISAGKITVAQFQTAMFRMRDHGTAFFDTLMVEGWITPSDIFDESSGLWDSAGAPAAAVPPAAPQAAPPPAAVEPLVPVEPLMEPVDEPAQSEDPTTNGHEPQPVAPAAVATSKVEFSDKWTKNDALAETQTLDVHEFRKRLEARSREEKGD